MASKSTFHSNITPFDGSGYSNWEFRMKLLLEHHEVLETLSVDPPTTEKELTVFTKNDIKAKNLIANFLSDKVLEMVKGKSTA